MIALEVEGWKELQFVVALMHGLRRFAQFLKAPALDLSGVRASKAETQLVQQMKTQWSQGE